MSEKVVLVKFAVLSPAPMCENRGIVTSSDELFGSMTRSETTSAGSVGKVMFSVSVTGEEMVKSLPICDFGTGWSGLGRSSSPCCSTR